MQTLKTRTTRMKRRLALFVAVIMTLTLWTAVPLQASADGTYEGYTYTLSGGSATITGYTGADATTRTELAIPSSVTEGSTSYPVTAIGANAFGANIAVTTIKIPATVTGIPLGADTFPASLTTITVAENNPIFCNIEGQDGILFGKTESNARTLVCYPRGKPENSYEIPASVTNIGYLAFFNAAALKTVTIPETVTNITEWAFHKSGLTSVTIPNGITELNKSLFRGCPSLSSVTLPDSVTSIGENAFLNCSALISIILSKNLETVGGYAFSGCTKLASIDIPYGATSIESYAFQNCTSLATVTIPGSVKNVAYQSFLKAGVTSLTLQEGIESIASNAFEGCMPLQSVTIPASVNSVGGNAFKDCNLTNVTLLNKSGQATYSVTSFNTSQSSVNVWLYENSSAKNVSFNGSKQKIYMIEDIVIVDDEEDPVDELTFESASDPAATLSVTYSPEGQTETQQAAPAATWTSSNPAAATVNPNTGTVMAVAPGTALITATVEAHGGEKAASIPVTVAAASGTPHALTVSNGQFAGNGPFVKDAKVTIVAAKAPDGMVFDKWELVSSTGGSIAEASEPTTVFTMPDAAATVRATYKHILYTATVENGTGGGSYASGATVNISANAAPSGKVFDSWTSDDVIFASATSSTTSFVMPAKIVTVKANYKDAPVTPPPAQTYAVTITGGTDGANGAYAEGATVTITAGAPTSGKVFDTWTSSDGVTFANANSASTSFVMPAKAVTVTATYKDEPVDPPVNPPAENNGWVYANGTWKFYADGEAVTGWIHDGKAWYYLNSDGEMQTGWIYDHNKWYYLAGNGAMKTGWVQTDGSWYYLSGNGAMIASTWFHDTDGSWYYLSGNGKMLTGKQNIGGKTYTFKSNGVWIG